MYPNPGSRNQAFNVAYELQEAGYVSIRVYDINGHLLQEVDQKYAPEGITNEILELNGYTPGIYFIQVQTEKTNLNRKLIIY